MNAFRHYGQPKAIRVDNGLPFNDPGSDIPPVMSLWLIGLGVDVLWNRPARPTDNAKVERMQGVTANWVEPHQCADRQMVNTRLEAALLIQRTRYRCREFAGQTRAERYPELLQSQPDQWSGTFDIERVFHFLAQGHWLRRVSKTGQVEFFNQRWSTGRAYARQEVSIRLEDHQWVVRDEVGKEIKRFSASFINEHDLWALSLSQRATARSLQRKT